MNPVAPGDEVGHAVSSPQVSGGNLYPCARAAAALAAGEARRARQRRSAACGRPAAASMASPASSGWPNDASAAARSASIVSCGKRGEALGDLERALEVRARRDDLGDAGPSRAPRRRRRCGR